MLGVDEEGIAQLRRFSLAAQRAESSLRQRLISDTQCLLMAKARQVSRGVRGSKEGVALAAGTVGLTLLSLVVSPNNPTLRKISKAMVGVLENQEGEAREIVRLAETRSKEIETLDTEGIFTLITRLGKEPLAKILSEDWRGEQSNETRKLPNAVYDGLRL